MSNTLSNFMLNGAQATSNLFGLSHFTQGSKDAYQGEYRKAATNFTEATLRFAVTGLATLFVINQLNQRIDGRYQPCLEAPGDPTTIGGYSYNSHDSTCSLAGRIGGVCHHMGLSISDDFDDHSNHYSIRDCVRTIFSATKNESGAVSLIAQNVYKVADGVKSYCSVVMKRLNVDLRKLASQKETQLKNYHDCLNSTLSDFQLLRNFI